MKRFNFAWINICLMVILAGVIFLNRSLHFYQAKSAIGYIIYGLFIITALLAILGIVLTLINNMKAKNAPPPQEKTPADDPHQVKPQ